ncbi:MAG TPA: D-amino acid dehydrogenase [Burkholderiales bacterium]|nr:D-amino acid dehydrogenase [Burkholderiales bacterium]
MKVLVLGAGVVGITSAHYLAQDGHEVSVVDRQPGPGMGASAANAGEVAPGCALPWAAPGMRMRLMKAWLRSDPGLRVKMRLDPPLLQWLRAFSRQCDATLYHRNALRMQRLARYSLCSLQALRRSANLEYAQTTDGVLLVLRTHKELQAALRRLPLYEELGTPYTVLDPQGCVAVDPSLEFAWTRFVGGLYLPMDETGDCGAFTAAVAANAAARGVSFRYATDIEGLDFQNDVVSGVRTSAGVLQADRYIMALGDGVSALLRPLGLQVPLQSVRGYSVTLPLANASRAPRAGIIDTRNEIAITRIGNRVRIGGGADFGVTRPKTNVERAYRLVEAFNELYPYAADLSQPQYWAGDYMSTPDGPPILGHTPYANLLLNIGHGSQGWTMACGAARVISDLVAARPAEIDLDGLGLARFRNDQRA